MANELSGMEELQKALRDEETKDQSQQVETKKEETKVEEKEPEAVKEEEVEEVKEEVKEESKEEPKKEEYSKGVQKRFNALTERLIDKDKRIEELEKKMAESNNSTKAVKEEVTKDQVIALLNDESQKQYHPWAFEKLAELKAKETMQQEREKDKEQVTKEKLIESVAKSYAASIDKFPDMADTESPLWQKANEIYIAKGLAKDPDGQYIAAMLANELLQRDVEQTSEVVLEKRLAKETGKKSLSSVNRKAIVTTDDKLLKLEKEALKNGFDSPEWNKYLRELEAEKEAKKK